MDLADALREGGAVVGGSSALFAGGAWIVAALLVDVGVRVDVTRWVQRGGGIGAALGMAALVLRAAEVH